MHQLDFSVHVFHPVIHIPLDYEVFDFTQGYDPQRELKSPYGIGRYDEKRAGMYTSDLFAGTAASPFAASERRDVHMGIDIGAPVGTPIHAFFEGEIYLAGYNAAKGDYGGTLITRHLIGDVEIYALHGHLSRSSIEPKIAGTVFKIGEGIAWVGDRHENGGWNPHLHFQLSLVRPEVCDMPGVVTETDREWARSVFPDPRLVLGRLY